MLICFFESILTPIYVDFLKEFIDEDFLSKENNIRGGVRDRDENEFTVFPINLLSFIVITVTPVTNFDIDCLNRFKLIFFI